MTVEIGPKVNELAEKIAEDALSDDDKAFRLDCFKALSTFFIGMTRISGKMHQDEDDSIGLSLPEMRARIAGAGQAQEPQLVASARRRASGEARNRDRNGRFE